MARTDFNRSADLVVGVDIDGLDEGRVGDVRNEVEDLLQHVGDLVVHRKLAVNHLKTKLEREFRIRCRMISIDHSRVVRSTSGNTDLMFKVPFLRGSLKLNKSCEMIEESSTSFIN